MQSWRFDDLTRALGKATSRRQVLKGLLGGVTAASVARGGGLAASGCSVAQCKADADAHYQEEYQACKQDGSRGAGFCNIWFLIERSFNYRKCDRTGCYSGVCCGQECANLYIDPQNCGSCGHACQAGAICVAGRCRCPNDMDSCNGSCADTDSDRNNCGACGHVCPSGETCSDGQCQCPDGSTMCNGTCVDTQSDDENCGSCGNACTGCEACLGGQCTSICGSDGYCCNDEYCVSAQCNPPKIFDPGRCSCVCPFGEECGDTCCTGSQECCQGQCYDPCPSGEPRDPATCQCGCSSGIQCGDTCCSDGQECCNDQCVDACPQGQQRDTGTCGCVCATGETCGPHCCSGNDVCCPDTLSGMACRNPDAHCPGCQFTCGDICCDQYQYCCRAADYSFHCVASSGDSC